MTNYSKFLFLIVPLLASTLFAQKKELTLEQAYLFGAPKLTKALPKIETWDNSGSYLIKAGKKINIVDVASNEKTLLLDYDLLNESLPEGFDLSKAITHTDDYQIFILEKSNDIYLFNREKNKLTRITNDESKENNPTLSPDGNFIAYSKNHDLFFYDLNKEKESQLTNDGSEVILNGYASWIDRY